MAAKIAADQIIKKWLAPALVGGAAATQSEDADAGFASLLAKGASKDGAMAAVGRYYDDFIDPKSFKNPNDLQDANESLMAQYLMSKDAGNSRQGWFVGADGRPRFEFNDASASVDKRFNRNVQGMVRDKVHNGEDMISALGLLLKHDNLFNLYPDFKDMPLIFQTGEEIGGAAAGYVPPSDIPASIMKRYPGSKSGLMVANADYMLEGDREEFIRTLLHEAQHGIQNFEGMSAGASSSWTPDEFLSKHLDYSEKAGPKADLMHKLITDAEKLDSHVVEGSPRPADAHQQELSRFFYGLNAGEAEARAVELRRRLKAGERAEQPAWMDYTEWYDRPRGHRSLFDFIESK
jgi:hypothetical protein